MAAEFAASAAANAVGNLAAECASPYVSYFFLFEKIVEDFKNERKQLELKKVQVENDVEAAIRQTEVIEKDVQEWLKEAEKELEETGKLETEIDRQKCFNWCPNWGWRYCLSKKIAEKTSSIDELLQRCDFQRVGYHAPLKGIEFFPSKDFKSSESSNLAFDGIMRALNTNGVNMIGLYGMPGVGKTTLAKEVGRQATEQKLFDKSVMVTISQNPNFSDVQDRIAELLGLKFEATTERGKEEELWRGLKAVKKILIIIDDVWNEFRLQTIGIPFGVQHEGCKILLTTRLEQVCVRMECQEKFQLDILSEDDAWALFKDNTGLKDDSLALINEAKEVASECKGLPLAIVTIGKSLKGADLNQWRAANRRLKDLRQLDNSEGIYKCLKLSYDYLNGDDIRSCFLLCSLFPEDSYIAFERLIMFGIGYGLFSNVSCFDVLRVEIRDALRKLQESGLLLKDDEEEEGNEIYVRMHDVVRDFAHWTTWREKNAFMVKEGLTEWPISESFRCCTSISFWKSDINNFPDKLDFPKLKMLVFEGKSFVTVPSTFVEGMKALQILHLKNVFFSLKVIKIVRNLPTLCFEDCTLENISSLKYLESLEFLALLETNIYELPEDLVVLRRLKSLHFYLSGSQEANFPPNLLSRLRSLQELHVTCRNNVNLSELNSLSRLTALSLIVSTDQIFPENFVFPAKLQSFLIFVNRNNRGYMKGLKFRCFEINDFSSSLSAFKELFCNAEKLTLERCDDVECLMDTTRENRPTTVIFSNLVELKIKHMPCLKELCHGPLPTGFLPCLKDVRIAQCAQLRVIFQVDEILENEEITSHLPILSNLTSLHLYSLPNLEDIWRPQSTHQNHAYLQNLKIVTVKRCSKLKFIFSNCVPHSLLQLQELDISCCNESEKVFEHENIELPRLQRLALKRLESLIIFCSSELLSLEELEVEACPRLSSICGIIRCSEVKDLCLFNVGRELCEEIIQPQGGFFSSRLKKLTLKELYQLEVIFKDPSQIVTLQNLSHLTVYRCNKLRYIFSVRLAQNLLKLSHLEVEECEALEQVFDFQQEMVELENIELPRLQRLALKRLKSLTTFCSREFPIKLPSLEELGVEACPQFSIYEIIRRCEVKDFRLFKVRDEFSEEITELHGGYVFSTPEKLMLKELSELQLLVLFNDPRQIGTFQNLSHLTVYRCNKLRNMFSTSLARNLLNLSHLEVEECEELEQVFDFPQEMTKREDIKLPQLRRLALKRLESLTNFCSREFPIGLPSLEELEVEACPQLLSICDILSGRQVTNLRLFDVRGKLCEDIIELKGGFFLSRLEKLMLKEQSELEVIFKDPSQIVTLQNLSHLTVFKFNKLRNIFSVRLARNLPHLSQLEVGECEELEQVVAQDEISSSSMAPPEEVCFPNLEEVCIMECNKLRSLFPVSFCRLPKLKRLQVKYASKLRKIFGHHGDANMTKDEILKEVSLPKLEELVLENLPNLILFATGGYCFVFPALIKLKVKECPNTIMKFSHIHDDSGVSYVRAKIEESMLPKEGNVGSSITIQAIQECAGQNIVWVHSGKGELVPGKRNKAKPTLFPGKRNKAKTTPFPVKGNKINTTLFPGKRKKGKYVRR